MSLSVLDVRYASIRTACPASPRAFAELLLRVCVFLLGAERGMGGGLVRLLQVREVNWGRKPLASVRELVADMTQVYREHLQVNL